jgi:putative flippase GtrA
MYILIGCTCAICELIIFSILASSMGILFSNSISIIVGISISFMLNSLYNFKKIDKIHRRAIKFITVNGIGFGISNIFMYLFSNQSKILELKIFTMVVVASIQYILNKKWTFRTYGNK